MSNGSTPAPPHADDRTRVRIAGVEHRYRTVDGSEVHALGPVDRDIEPGSFVCLVGPSGCGKTTLLRLVAGFITPTAGTVDVGGVAVDGPGPDRGVVFQHPPLFPWLDVLGNVEFGLRMRRVPKRDRRATAERWLEVVGLADSARLATYELSGGMQQRVQLARVLACDPSIVLMDEPFGALDALTRERLQDELLDLWRGSGRTVIFVTHSVDEAVYLGTRAVVLGQRPGQVVLDVAVPDVDRSSTPQLAELRSRLDLSVTSP